MVSHETLKTDDDKLKFFLASKAATSETLTAAIFVPSQSLGAVAQMQEMIPPQLTVIEDANTYSMTMMWLIESTKDLIEAVLKKIPRDELSKSDELKLLQLRVKAFKTYSDYYSNYKKIDRAEERFEKANRQWWKDWETRDNIRPTTQFLADRASLKRQKAYAQLLETEKKLMELVQEFNEFRKSDTPEPTDTERNTSTPPRRL